MFATLLSRLFAVDEWGSPVAWVLVGFQIWMLVDAIRRGEWMWVVFMFIFPLINPVLYYFLVYRTSSSATRGFELPGSHDRKRIKELEAQIHHLDNAAHHLQLGDVYFQMGKLAKAEASYRAALARDATDLDTRAHLGQCLLRLKRPAEARPLLEQVCAENPRHDFGHSLMALAETLTELKETDAAVRVWQRVLEHNSYARARVQLAELYLAKRQDDLARAELKEVLADDAHAPVFQRKRDKVWIRRAKKLLK
jgi:hypothetical protein